MAQRLTKERRKRHRRSLFSRILIALTFPLLTLILLFTAIQLGSEMKNLNKRYQLESRFAFESIQKGLQLVMSSQSDGETGSLKEAARELEALQEGIRINFYDLFQRQLLSDNGSSWDSFDSQSLEQSLLRYQQGRPYLIRINKSSKEIIAYIPLENMDGDVRFVARARFPLGNLSEALANARWMLILMVLLIVITGAVIGYRLSNSIVKPIQTLNDATRMILKGELGRHVHIRTGDEIEGLASTFNKMSDSLEDMKKKAQDSNPLTGLPGNQGIFSELKRRIYERQKFVLFHTDLDRFKVFNDHYGLGKGDEAIKQTADLLRRAIKEKGADDDFIGHQGGDDFVVVTRPHKAAELAEFITKTFDDEVVKALYPKEDVERGHTLQLDRRRLAETGEEVMTEFPLLALSLAGVSSAKKDFADYFDCMSAAVSVKKEVKSVIESSYKIKE